MEEKNLLNNIKNYKSENKYTYRITKTLFIYDESLSLHTPSSMMHEFKRTFKSKTCSIVFTHVFGTGITIGFVKTLSRHKILPIGKIFEKLRGIDKPFYKLYPDFSKELELDILKYILHNPNCFACNDVIRSKLDKLELVKKNKKDLVVGSLIEEFIKINRV